MSERNIDKILNDFYGAKFNEDARFNDRDYKLEFITTTKYIDKYLKAGDRILEIGAGTGAYSIHYAERGYQVDAVELVQTNLAVLNSKKDDSLKLNAIQGNAIDLSIYKDNTFDVTLLLGPLYHLFAEDEVKRAIEEAIRVTKPSGKIYFAFILFDLAMITWGFQAKGLYDNFGDGKVISTDYKPNNAEELIFNLRIIDDIKALLNQFNIKTLHYIAADGIAPIIKNCLEDMTEQQYNMYIDYHLSTCERQDLVGYSAHLLVIAEK